MNYAVGVFEHAVVVSDDHDCAAATAREVAEHLHNHAPA
jgi:hypothetical protein